MGKIEKLKEAYEKALIAYEEAAETHIKTAEAQDRAWEAYLEAWEAYLNAKEKYRKAWKAYAKARAVKKGWHTLAEIVFIVMLSIVIFIGAVIVYSFLTGNITFSKFVLGLVLVVIAFGYSFLIYKYFVYFEPIMDQDNIEKG